MNVSTKPVVRFGEDADAQERVRIIAIRQREIEEIQAKRDHFIAMVTDSATREINKREREISWQSANLQNYATTKLNGSGKTVKLAGADLSFRSHAQTLRVDENYILNDESQRQRYLQLGILTRKETFALSKRRLKELCEQGTLPPELMGQVYLEAPVPDAFNVKILDAQALIDAPALVAHERLLDRKGLDEDVPAQESSLP